MAEPLVELAMPQLFIFLCHVLSCLWLILTTTIMLLFVDDYSIGVTLLLGIVTMILRIVDRGLRTSLSRTLGTKISWMFSYCFDVCSRRHRELWLLQSLDRGIDLSVFFGSRF